MTPPERRRFRSTALVAAIALVVGALVPVVGAAPTAQAAETVLPATAVAWTTTRQPTSVQKSNTLSVTATADRTYLKFDASELAGRKITSAKLVVQVKSTTATKRGIVVLPSSTVWHPATLTAANSPAVGRDPVSLQNPVAKAGQKVEIPLDVEELASTITPSGQISVRLQYQERYIRLLLARTGANAPRIVVQTTDAEAPRPTPTSSPVPSATPSPSASPTQTPRPTPAPTQSPTPTQDPSPTPAPPRSDGQPLVFAHYFVPYPLSLDNENPATDYYARHYLSPSGENGKFASTGGLLRDRPLSPAVSKASDWRVANFATEIQQAKSAGIDGWTLNLMSTGGQNWDASINIMKAADRVGGFSVVPMVDASSGSAFGSASPETVASLLSQLYSYKSAYKEDGEFLLSTFKAEGQTVAWWTEVISLLENKYKLPITFLAVFLNAGDANMRAFSGIADGFGNWGTRSERTTLNSPDYDARAEALGKTWMEPVAVQDVRYKSASWAESNNTASVRAQWDKAIREGVDYVQLVTWNDYSESTQIAPSQAHGSAFLDLTRYYTSWFHTGAAPKITSDEIVVTHRTQFTDAGTSSGQPTLMGSPALEGTATAARNAVEVVVWLTAPATVEVTVGGTTSTFAAPAGVSAHTVALQLGNVSARVTRSGEVSASVTSPHTVVSTPFVQDLQYFAASSW